MNKRDYETSMPYFGEQIMRIVLAISVLDLVRMKTLRMFCLQFNHNKPPQLCIEDGITSTHICSPQINKNKILEYEHMRSVTVITVWVNSHLQVSQACQDLAEKRIVVIGSLDFSQTGNYCTKEDVFGRQFFFHSNKVILRLNVKQHLSLPSISSLGDPLLEYTYNFSLFKIVISPSLANPLGVIRCHDS